MNSKSTIRGSIKLNSDDWHGLSSEVIWLEPFGDNDLYLIKNVPFYATGISYNDIVFVEVIDDENQVKFVVRRSGHSTYRIILLEGISVEKFRTYWRSLEEIGCTYEKGSGNLYAIDVPSETDINEVYKLLEYGEQNEVWDFEEGYFGHSIT